MPTPRTRFEEKKGRVVRKVDLTAPPKLSASEKEKKRKAMAARHHAAKVRKERFEARQKELAEKLTQNRQRVIAKCPGLPERGVHPARACGRLVKITLGQGRPWTRCGECRVLDVWRQNFVREDPQS